MSWFQSEKRTNLNCRSKSNNFIRIYHHNGIFPVIFLTSSWTAGMQVEPPMRITSSISLKESFASLKAVSTCPWKTSNLYVSQRVLRKWKWSCHLWLRPILGMWLFLLLLSISGSLFFIFTENIFLFFQFTFHYRCCKWPKTHWHHSNNGSSLKNCVEIC